MQNLNICLDEMPEQRGKWRIVDAEECVQVGLVLILSIPLTMYLQDLQLSKRVIGAIATTAGALHPYRFVTGILSRLLADHPTKFATVFSLCFPTHIDLSQFSLIHTHSLPFDLL